MMKIDTYATPREAEAAISPRAKTASFPQSRPSTARPLSEATETHETEFEDDSELDDDYSPKSSFESDDSRRRSQTTISSYDEAPTPSSNRSRRQFELRFKPVEGPRGPHLFRESQSSADLAFDYSLQMSPMLPKEIPLRVDTSFSQETITPVAQERTPTFSIDSALVRRNSGEPDDARIRCWTPGQVIAWMCAHDIHQTVIDCFEKHDISGAVLVDLQFDDLKELGVESFGRRHELWSELCELRGVDIRGGELGLSPQPTPFQDLSRPCTTQPRRSPTRRRNGSTSDGDVTPISPAGGKKRRGRKASKHRDIITPAESVSIVAIEQLIPKPHKCAKGEACGRWKKQQRELKQLQDDHGIGRFPISPTKGGHIFVAGDPGNARTAANIVPNVHRQPTEDLRPTSDAVPSIVASSDLLGPGSLPEFALHATTLDRVDKRDPQDNVRQFIKFQHMHSPREQPSDLADPGSIPRSESVPLFPSQHHQAYPSMYPPVRSYTAGPPSNLRTLPKLDIPRSASAAPDLDSCGTMASPVTADALCRSATASPGPMIYRLGTPASEMDVPVTAIPTGPISRDVSQSVPPNMQFRQQTALSRSQSQRHAQLDWRRPSMVLPAVREGVVFSPANDPQIPSQRPDVGSRSNSGSSDSSLGRKASIRDPAHHSPTTQYFGYGADCTQAGWMKKRKTKMLRHEWHDAHFRLTGTQLAMHDTARLSSATMDTINVEDYAVACSSVSSGNKLAAAMKAFHIKHESAKKEDPASFAFQLVPSPKEGQRKAPPNTKTHHFAVKNKDDRIDWMRELMLAKALQQKGKGYDIEVNGVQA